MRKSKAVELDRAFTSPIVRHVSGTPVCSRSSYTLHGLEDLSAYFPRLIYVLELSLLAAPNQPSYPQVPCTVRPIESRDNGQRQACAAFDIITHAETFLTPLPSNLTLGLNIPFLSTGLSQEIRMSAPLQLRHGARELKRRRATAGWLTSARCY